MYTFELVALRAIEGLGGSERGLAVLLVLTSLNEQDKEFETQQWWRSVQEYLPIHCWGLRRGWPPSKFGWIRGAQTGRTTSPEL